MSSDVRFIEEEVREKTFVLVLHFNSGRRQDLRLPRSEAIQFMRDHFHGGLTEAVMYTSESHLHIINHAVIEHVEVRATKPEDLRRIVNES